MGLWLFIILFVPFDGEGPARNWQPARPISPAVSGAAAGERDRIEDWLLETQARAALWQDPVLETLTLDVTVRERVAILFGPTPTEAHRRRAEQCVRGVKELREVRNHLRVRTPTVLDQPRPRMFPPVDQPLAGTAEPVEAAAPDRAADGVLTGRPARPNPAAAPDTSPLEIGLSRLIASNPRFRKVTFSVKGSRVTLRGNVAQMAELIDLVNAVSQMDGVERVQTEEVSVGR